ncbi:MAG TPA: EAL domain-containing protein [Gemmatimonadaceae bacterium]|nr:EAL domain-containing protein [Gemmatimonadaceae bacterium]
MMTPARKSSVRRFPSRESAGRPLAPQGRWFIWCPGPQTQAKIVAQLHAGGAEYDLAEGDCIISDVAWDVMRDLVIPIRRVLTHREAEDVRALFKPAGGELTTADFPRVQSYTAFSLVSQSSWLSEMLAERRFTSVLQPIVWANEPRRVFAHEALLRGVAKDEAIVYPNYIFDVARGCGMLVQVDLAARQAAIDRMVLDDVGETLFVNLAPSAIEDPISSLERTVAMIDEARIAHRRIVFEVVESDEAHDVQQLKGLLRFYRDAGFRVALDDVGAGYSSLNLLHQLRPDFVKLDMDLIRGVHADAYKGLVAHKIIEIATTLGVETIAEGVETEEELAWVQTHGATYAQGYGIARPTTPTLSGRTPLALERLVS